jgi:hypothetical protein
VHVGDQRLSNDVFMIRPELFPRLA